MKTIKKLVLFEGGVETLSYFSHELSAALERSGYQIFFYDISQKEAGLKHVCRFARSGQTAVITFNFIGLSGEDFLEEAEGRSVWENRRLPSYCIMVDHPMYYHKQLESKIPDLTVFCIDRQHVAYVKRFYPKIPCHFLPLAGNLRIAEYRQGNDGMVRKSDWIPYRERAYDVAFIANYVHLPRIEEHFTSQTQEYIDFYYEILRAFQRNPKRAVDETMEQFVKREIPNAADKELKAAFSGMLFLDLYNRTYFRGQTVRMLVDNGIPVHVFGKGWEKLCVKHPEKLIANGTQLDSAQCVDVIRNAKIALNTMPWFKDGAHDRIFTAMLNGAVSLTDESIYLKERFKDKSELCFYELERLEELPKLVHSMLEEPDRMEQITRTAYRCAAANDTWAQRAAELETYLL